MRLDPDLAAGAWAFYANGAEGCVAFINHWVDTYDPRRSGKGKLTRIPLIMFPGQEDLVHFIFALIEGEEDGLIEKARDMGATWICCAISVWLWLFRKGSAVGWGSRKQDLVDRLGVVDSIFEKLRMIIRGLPKEFLPIGFDPEQHLTFMRCLNPETGAAITGEAGDAIGRGGRNLIYFKDESAHYERPEKIEAALADNTNVQVDISSVNGLGNVFHRRRENGKEWVDGPAHYGVTNVFVLPWEAHPAKDREWYERRRRKAEEDGLLHLFAQEVDRSYTASVEGVIIKAEWIEAAIDAEIKLGLENATGPVIAALDVADEGGDKNALARRRSYRLLSAEDRAQGKSYQTTKWAIDQTTMDGPVEVHYDSIGVGAGIKSEANRLAEVRELPTHITFVPWNASSGPLYPKEHMEPLSSEQLARGEANNSPLNEDYYDNIKAQGWRMLARRFEKTYRAVVEGVEYPAEELISIPSSLPKLHQLRKELGQVTQGRSQRTNKMLVNKNPPGTRSPNIADSVMMAYWPMQAVGYQYDIMAAVE